MITTTVTWQDYKLIRDLHTAKYIQKAVDLAGPEYENPISWQELPNGNYEIVRAWPNVETAEAFLAYCRQEEESGLLVSAVLSQ